MDFWIDLLEYPSLLVVVVVLLGLVTVMEFVLLLVADDFLRFASSSESFSNAATKILFWLSFSFWNSLTGKNLFLLSKVQVPGLPVYSALMPFQDLFFHSLKLV